VLEIAKHEGFHVPVLGDYSANTLVFCGSIESGKEGVKGLIIFFEQPPT
jgi:hypothetical protein